MRGLSVALALGGCYAPSAVAPCTVTCDLATAPDCPSGLECHADGRCHTPGSDDCPSPPGDSGVDGIAFTTNVMFVTSTKKAPQDFGGLMGADHWCNEAAKAGQLPQGTYVAWLSTTAIPAPMDAIDRLSNSRGWMRPDGRPFVDSFMDLTDGKILYPPRLDELGHELPEMSPTVATATDANGRRNGPACADYTALNNDAPSVGLAVAGTELWTHTGNRAACATPVHIYCFGIGREEQVPLSPPPPGALRAFQSLGTFAPDPVNGPSTADTMCNSEAMMAGLPQKFTAFLATETESAVHRVGGVGPWYRLDGVEIGSLADLSEMIPLTPEAPINYTAGMQYTFDSVWTGAATTVQNGNAGSTCGSWFVNASTQGVYGDAALSDGTFFHSATALCSIPNHVYCMEHH